VVKHYLTERGVRYELRNLNTDAAAREEFLRRGFRLPPVLVIDGVAVEGYDPDRFDALLGA
jgi:glutaredoxin